VPLCCPLFDNKKLGFENVLQSHIDATRQRLVEQPVAILAQDTTEVDLTRPSQQVAGAGPMDGSARRGAFLHLLHACPPAGPPLGTVAATVWTRPNEPGLPEVSCEVIFEPSEWKSAWRVVRRSPPPSQPPKLSEMVRLVAQLGGYVNRKRKDEPGPQTVWLGLQRLHDIALCWQLFGPEVESEQILV